MSGPRDHPHLLLWYVSGDLDPRQARETEAHLSQCPGCATEVASLTSMLEAIRRDYPGGPPLSRRTPAAGADLRRPAPGPASRSRGRNLVLRAAAAAAVSAAVLAAPFLASRWRSEEEGSAIRVVRPVPFAPTQRGEPQPRELPGRGPWAITVMLPFGSPEGRYEMRISRVEAGPSGPAVILPTDGQGHVSVVLDSLPDPGRYVMVLRSLDAVSLAPAIFEFTSGPQPPVPPD